MFKLPRRLIYVTFSLAYAAAAIEISGAAVFAVLALGYALLALEKR
jgi:hypothetical protein